LPSGCTPLFELNTAFESCGRWLANALLQASIRTRQSFLLPLQVRLLRDVLALMLTVTDDGKQVASSKAVVAGSPTHFYKQAFTLDNPSFHHSR
jgi:hypothetical protein